MTGKLLAIDHVQLAMPAGGESRARLFYGELLGLLERAKPAHLAGRGGVWFEQGDLKVHLGIDPDFIPARKAHVAFRTSELPQLIRRLESAGCVCTESEGSSQRQVYVHDPFGNRLELMA